MLHSFHVNVEMSSFFEHMVMLRDAIYFLIKYEFTSVVSFPLNNMDFLAMMVMNGKKIIKTLK